MKVGVNANFEWKNKAVFLVGWGSSFDPDDNTYKVFTTNGGYILEHRRVGDIINFKIKKVKCKI